MKDNYKIRFLEKFIRIKKNQNILINGGAGFGKSSLIKDLMLKSNLNEFNCVVLAGVDDLQINPTDLKMRINFVYHNLCFATDNDIFELIMNYKSFDNILFVIDDLNILKQHKLFNNYIKFFKQDNVTLVTTTKPSFVLEDFKFDKTINLQFRG